MAEQATIVSIVPFEITLEVTMIPHKITIPKSVDGEPVFVTIGMFHDYKYLGEGLYTGIVKDPYQTGAQIIDSYIRTYPITDSVSKPGITILQGNISKIPKDELEQLQIWQENWFRKIHLEGRDFWYKYQNPRFINELHKLSAKSLNLPQHEVPYMSPAEMFQFDECPVCGEAVKRNVIVCKHCNAILNQDEYDKYKFTTFKTVR